MAQILIHDLFEELSQENQRLLHRLKSFEEMHELFAKYRQLMIALNVNCICDQNIGHKKTFNSLETKYTTISNRFKTCMTDTDIKPIATNPSDNGTHHRNRQRVVQRSGSNKSKTNSKTDHNCIGPTNGDQSEDNFNDNEVKAKQRLVEPNTTISGAIGESSREKRHCCESSGCGKRFRDRYALVAHIRLKHTNDKPFACNECHKTFPIEKYLKSHQMIHSVVKSYKCKYDCPYASTTHQSLNSHYTTHHSSDAVKKFVCDWVGCGKRFRANVPLMAHIRITHTKEKPFPCDVCDERFATKFFLKRHQLTHPSAQSLTCDYTDCAFETLFHKILTAHMKGHDLSPQFPCDESGCDHSFYTLRALKQHKSTRIHNPDFVCKKQKKLHVCYWIGCAKSFQSNHLLVAHIRLRHTNEKPFKCDECGKEFAIDLYLRKHQKLHSIDKQFKCEYNGCSYETSRKADFDSHVLRHTGVPTVKCDEIDCNKSFYTVNALKVHKKTTHRDDRPLACNWPGCEARFKTHTAIRRHKNIHLGVPKYRCDIEGCRKSFVNPGYLRQHEREHTKPFVCSWPACERRYGSNDRLVDHQNAHLDLRANKCPVSGCDRSFFSKPSVRQHLRQVHKYAKTDGLLPITKR